jgi:hypothetical protein
VYLQNFKRIFYSTKSEAKSYAKAYKKAYKDVYGQASIQAHQNVHYEFILKILLENNEVINKKAFEYSLKNINDSDIDFYNTVFYELENNIIEKII